MLKNTEFLIRRSERVPPTRTRTLIRRVKKGSQECALKRILLAMKRKTKIINKFASYDSIKFAGAHCSINSNNNNAARKYMSL